MKNASVIIIPVFLALLLALPGAAPAQKEADLTGMLVESYDLLEAGKLEQAQKIYEQILQQDPGNPLALNNLGAIKVKEKKYQDALTYLEQALARAKRYKVMVNRVCDAEGLCLAFRPLMDAYGNQDLEPLVRLNVELVKSKLAAKH